MLGVSELWLGVDDGMFGWLSGSLASSSLDQSESCPELKSAFSSSSGVILRFSISLMSLKDSYSSES